MKIDSTQNFLDKYSKGKILEAFQEILPNPEFCYESLTSPNDLLLQLIINYVDASVNGFAHNAHIANQILLQYLNSLSHPSLAIENAKKILLYEQTLQYYLLDQNDNRFKFNESNSKLHPEINRALFSRRNDNVLQGYEILGALNTIPSYYKESFKAQMQLIQNFNLFKLQKPKFSSLLKHPHFPVITPWQAYQYPVEYDLQIEDSSVPMLFLEPYKANYKQLESIEKTPAIFVFETIAQFLQMFQFSDVAKSLNQSNHLIYILEKYPNEQFLSQNHTLFKDVTFLPIFMTNSPLKENFEIFSKYFKTCINQSTHNLENKNFISNQLYFVSKQCIQTARETQLGQRKAATYQEWLWAQEAFRVSSDIIPNDDLEKMSQRPNYFETHLKTLAAAKSKRNFIKNNKIKIAHITPQICTLGHAPTRLLNTFVEFHNSELFEITIISSERLCFRRKDYPQLPGTSPSSNIRGEDLIAKYRNSNIPVHIADTNLSLEETALFIAKTLKEAKIDVAIFHGPDTINLIAANLSDVPLIALFEHGMPPEFPGFDIALVSSEEALTIYKNKLANLNITSYGLPFSVDAKAQWKHIPTPKIELGLPENSVVLTTISNNLEIRLTSEMCRAIEAILAKCPQAFYAPMGLIFDENKLRTRFSPEANKRIRFLGHRDFPSQDARVMDIYLNEFPVGSGLSILEAMAAGCPIVTMYDEHGAQAARYGGTYFGIDRAITNYDRKAYVELACKLINDIDMRKEWSQHALNQYAKFSDVKGYVKQFENIILKYFNF